MAALRAALALGLTGPALAQALGFEEREAAPEAPATPALPSLRDCAKRYLDEDTAHLASPTQRDREIMLREDGSLLRYFGDVALDAITPAICASGGARRYSAVGLRMAPPTRTTGAPGEAT